ncbi:MAG TPA: ABC transporter permease subunit [Trueperaceae bacterium]|nr:ABC transporter permease subunit [Trueperaceae bacterium]
MLRGSRVHYLSMIAVAVLAAAGVIAIIVTAPEPIVRDRMLVIPGGWQRFLGIFALVCGGIAALAYLYGLATRPLRAGRYALTAGTHVFMWVVIVLVFYPVVYLFAVSFNRNNTLAGALPREGNLLVRSGVIPDPADISTIQYTKVLQEFHVLWYQWILVAVLGLAVVALVSSALVARRGRVSAARLDDWRRLLGWTVLGSAALLIVSVHPGQFYGVGSQGRITPASIGGMVPLYIRNTLLVSGTTGLMAVMLATPAGYAFSRLRFEGRYSTLLTFVFVQMFPTFMALVAIFYLMSRLDLLNTFTGLILAYSGGAIAFSTWIFKGYLDSISPALEESAMVDGATRFGAFVRVILPVSIPMLLFIFLNQFIGTYSEFILANTLLVGQELWTVGVGLRNFSTNQFATQWGAMAAAAVLGSIPILAIFYSFQDSLTGQHTAGSVKG